MSCEKKRIQFAIPLADRVLVKLKGHSLRIYSIMDDTVTRLEEKVPRNSSFVVPVRHGFFLSRDGKETKIWSGRGELVQSYIDQSRPLDCFFSLNPGQCLSYCIVEKELVIRDCLQGTIVSRAGLMEGECWCSPRVVDTHPDDYRRVRVLRAHSLQFYQ